MKAKLNKLVANETSVGKNLFAPRAGTGRLVSVHEIDTPRKVMQPNAGHVHADVDSSKMCLLY